MSSLEICILNGAENLVDVEQVYVDIDGDLFFKHKGYVYSRVIEPIGYDYLHRRRKINKGETDLQALQELRGSDGKEVKAVWVAKAFELLYNETFKTVLRVEELTWTPYLTTLDFEETRQLLKGVVTEGKEIHFAGETIYIPPGKICSLSLSNRSCL